MMYAKLEAAEISILRRFLENCLEKNLVISLPKFTFAKSIEWCSRIIDFDGYRSPSKLLSAEEYGPIN